MWEHISTMVVAGIGVLATVVSGWTSWFFARKKYNSEVDNNVIENMHESLEFYKKLSDDNKARLDLLVAQNAELQKKVLDLTNQVAELKLKLKSTKPKNEANCKKDV